jgi:hypothetical protein
MEPSGGQPSTDGSPNPNASDPSRSSGPANRKVPPHKKRVHRQPVSPGRFSAIPALESSSEEEPSCMTSSSSDSSSSDTEDPAAVHSVQDNASPADDAEDVASLGGIVKQLRGGKWGAFSRAMGLMGKSDKLGASPFTLPPVVAIGTEGIGKSTLLARIAGFAVFPQQSEVPIILRLEQVTEGGERGVFVADWGLPETRLGSMTEIHERLSSILGVPSAGREAVVVTIRDVSLPPSWLLISNWASWFSR